MRMAPSDFGGVATYRASSTIVRAPTAPTPIVPYRPTVAPVNPAPPRMIPTPVLPTAPISHIVQTAPPISPISGQPINTSIFQPTSTPALIQAQASASTDSSFAMSGSSYAQPQSSFSAPSTPPTAPAPYQSVGNAPAQTTSGGFLDSLGISTNTLLVILAIIAVVVFMVAS